MFIRQRVRSHVETVLLIRPNEVTPHWRFHLSLRAMPATTMPLIAENRLRAIRHQSHTGPLINEDHFERGRQVTHHQALRFRQVEGAEVVGAANGARKERQNRWSMVDSRMHVLHVRR